MLKHQLDVVDVGRIQEIADPEILAVVGDVMQAEFLRPVRGTRLR